MPVTRVSEIAVTGELFAVVLLSSPSAAAAAAAAALASVSSLPAMLPLLSAYRLHNSTFSLSLPPSSGYT